MAQFSPDGWDNFRESIGMNLLDSIDMMAVILEAKTAEDLHLGLEQATKKCGFNTFVSGVQMVSADGSLQHSLISAYPLDWQLAYAERGYIWTDPTVIHCQSSLDPLVWDNHFFEKSNDGEMWEEASAFGLSHGVSVALHDLSGTKSMLSLVRDKSITECEQDGDDVVSAVRMIASCAHFASLRIAQQDLRSPDTVRLTRQETECLKWVSNGKTSKEISKAMSIAEPTVAFHLKNVMEKLGASNRPQALAIAIRMGYIN